MSSPALPAALDELEVRVLGVLIEKSLATPEQYPLSLNSLVAGCNQKSNRDPLMLVSEPEARLSIDGLRMKHLAGITHPAGGRVERYTHCAAETLGLPRPSLAVLAELLLRGPQARGELRARASRMAPIPTLEDLAGILERLSDKGFATEYPPEPGSRAPRIAHVLGGSVAATGTRAPAAAAPATGGVEARVADLERAVRELRRQLGELASRLGEPFGDS
jgi:hypothetical protein